MRIFYIFLGFNILWVYAYLLYFLGFNILWVYAYFLYFFRPGMTDTALGGVVGVYLGELQHREEMTVN